MTSEVQFLNLLASSAENPLASHISPRYDLHGRQLAYQITHKNSPAVKVPDSWKRENPISTQTQLVEQRKKDAAPDITYDLDGDGKVSPYEFFVSKLHDVDNNGKLMPQQRLDAQNAMGNGELDKFAFGLEGSGVNRSFRIIQKRGIIVDSDDFSKVASTYPALNSTPGLTKTRSQLLQTRKAQDVQQMTERREKWLAESNILTDYIPVTPTGYVQNPPISSIHQKKALEQQQARDKLGLSSPSDIKSYKSLGLSYISNPTYRSLSELKTARKSNMLDDLQQKKNFNHITRDQKLMERERNYINIIPEGQEKLTWAKLQQEIKKTDNQENMKKFSNIAIGIHGGKELPKFYEHSQEYWKEDQKSMPRINSHRILNSEKKYWAPKCPYLIADVTDQPPQIANSKEIALFNVIQKHELTEKPNNVVPDGSWSVADVADVIEKDHAKHHYRWSTLVNLFNQSSKSTQNLQSVSERCPSSKAESVKNRPNITLNSHENLPSGFLSTKEGPPPILSKKPSTVNIMANRISGIKPLPKTFLRSGGFSK